MQNQAIKLCDFKMDPIKGHLTPFCAKYGSLISYPTEHFSKLIFVRKILLNRPCEACKISNTAIGGLFSQL